MDSSVIRHLILKAKLGQGQISDIGAAVVDAAVKEKYLEKAPDIHDEGNAIWAKLTEVIWELLMEGVYTPGQGMRQPNLPFLRVTEYGQKCFDAGELTAHDPDGYLQRLREACPTIDGVTLLYTKEALETLRAGNHRASVVMIGVAAENMLLRLVVSVHGALDTAQRQLKFERKQKARGPRPNTMKY